MSSIRSLLRHLSRPSTRHSQLINSIISQQPTTRSFAQTPHAQAARTGQLRGAGNFRFPVPFTLDDVPPLQYWETACTEADPKEAHRMARTYTTAAIGGYSYLDGMCSDEVVGPKLHDIAICLMKAREGRAMWLMIHILYSLQARGYMPSLLTLVNFVNSTKMPRAHEKFPGLLENFEEHLKKIEQGIDDEATTEQLYYNYAADACTLRAVMYTDENTPKGDRNALRWYQRAHKIGNRRPTSSADIQNSSSGETKTSTSATADPYWQFKSRFVLGLATLRLKRNEFDKAEDLYRVAARDFDLIEGYDGLAKVLAQTGRRDTDEFRECLLKAAVSGSQEAAAELCDLEMHRSKDPGLTGWEKLKSEVFAQEWRSMGVGS